MRVLRYELRTWHQWRWIEFKTWCKLLYGWYSPKHRQKAEMNRRRIRARQGLL